MTTTLDEALREIERLRGDLAALEKACNTKADWLRFHAERSERFEAERDDLRLRLDAMAEAARGCSAWLHSQAYGDAESYDPAGARWWHKRLNAPLLAFLDAHAARRSET